MQILCIFAFTNTPCNLVLKYVEKYTTATSRAQDTEILGEFFKAKLSDLKSGEGEREKKEKK